MTIKPPYIESDCTVTFEGREFTSGGALVTDNLIIGYMSSDMKKINTWHGELISDNVKITGKWRTPSSYISDCTYQVKAFYNGRWYTGRTTGEGMIVKLRPCK